MEEKGKRVGKGGERRRMALLVGLALLLRLAVFARVELRDERRFLVPDSHSYLASAESLVEHGAFLDGNGKPMWGRVPAYPLLLATMFLFGLGSPDRLAAPILLQVLLGTLCVILAAKIGRHLGDHRTELWTALLVAVEPSCISYSNVILSEVLYAAVLLLVVLAARQDLLRPGLSSALMLGALAGLLPVIRPVGLYLPLLIVPLVFLAPARLPRKIGRCLLFLLLATLPAAAWTLRNATVLGSMRLHITGTWAQAIFAHDLEERLGIPSAGGAGPYLKPWENGFGRDQGIPAEEAARIQERYFRRAVLSHPSGAALLLAGNGARMMGVPDSLLPDLLLDDPVPIEGGSIGARLAWLGRQGPLGVLLLMGMAVSLGGLAGALFLAWRARRWVDPGRRVLLLTVLLVGYHVLLACFVGQQGERYRVPVIPLLALLLVSGIAAARRRSREGADQLGG
jgi:4-amino-4-deoxy-L-arabinose transferase-like glycosyltransferase